MSSSNGRAEDGELLLRFREACKQADGLQTELTNPQKLALYGLFKQATDPNGRSPAAPSRLSLIARAKWDAWYEVRQHVIVPSWQCRSMPHRPPPAGYRTFQLVSGVAPPPPPPCAKLHHHQHPALNCSTTATPRCVA